ncbi:MAG TPA: EI24 domain-containing protein [Aestuariivirga sp.]
MFTATVKALNDITSPDMRPVLWKSIALSVALFAGLLWGIEYVLSILASTPWPWLTSGLQLVTGLGLFAAFFYLMAPVTALFAGLFQDIIASKLEARHYSHQPAGKALTYGVALLTSFKFAGLALAVDLVVSPLVLFAGAGAVLILCANAYVISREYFELTAARYMPMADAVALRRDHTVRIFIAGLIPAALSMIPFVSFITPVFATSYFLHFFKGRAS